MYVYYCSTYYKAVREVGGGGNGGHVLRETTSRGRCELVCPSRTNERGGEEYCVKVGGGEEGERERRRSGAREGACRGGATILQPWIVRLIRNADAFAATRPTLGGNNGGHVCVFITAVPITKCVKVGEQRPGNF
jgi:hypothetical protein